jgi:hypothetical protein
MSQLRGEISAAVACVEPRKQSTELRHGRLLTSPIGLVFARERFGGSHRAFGLGQRGDTIQVC